MHIIFYLQAPQSVTEVRSCAKSRTFVSRTNINAIVTAIAFTAKTKIHWRAVSEFSKKKLLFYAKIEYLGNSVIALK